VQAVEPALDDMAAAFMGTCCLDWLLFLDEPPVTDTESRIKARESRRGGNSANSACVAALLGAQSAWVGTVADDAAGRDCVRDLTEYGVDVRGAVEIVGGATPTSYIMVVAGAGIAADSRTILHYRDLPELRSEQFDEALARVPFPLRWIQLECRGDIDRELSRMLDRCIDMKALSMGDEATGPKTAWRLPLVALELEKPRGEGERGVMLKADVVIVSSEWIRKTHREEDPWATIAELCDSSREWHVDPGAAVVVTMGARGCFVAARAADVETFLRSNPSVEALAAAADELHPLRGRERASECGFEALRGWFWMRPILLSNEWLERGDSVGTGDSFSGALSHAFCRPESIPSLCDCHLRNAVAWGARVAAAKLGVRGFRGIGEACVRVSEAESST
jgi:sugar/nucleoside kinase (ribokinase family)